MSAIIAIIWFIGLTISMFFVAATHGNIALVHMFPEGSRWWMPWSRIASMVVFAMIILANPITGWLA